MLRQLIQHRISEALSRLQTRQELPIDLPAFIEISDPKDPTHGDFACNFALIAAKPAGMNPRELGEKLRTELLAEDEEFGTNDERRTTNNESNPSLIADRTSPSDPSLFALRSSLFSTIDVAGPGFLNFRMTDSAWLMALAWANQVGEDLARPAKSSNVNPSRIQDQSSIPSPFALRPSPLRLNVEFVSVNPNGPITVGSGRGAAFGSTLCNVLEAAGHEVHREYYINDGTSSEQMRLFAESVRALIHSKKVPNSGYHGEYVGEVAKTASVNLPIWKMRLIELVNRMEAQTEKQQRETQAAQERLEALSINPGISGRDIDDPELPDDVKAAVRSARGSIANSKIWRRQLRKDLDLMKRFLSETRDMQSAAGSIAQALKAQIADLPTIAYQAVSQDLMLAQQREDLAAFSAFFNTWFSEQSLHDSGKVDELVDELIAKGAADDKPIRHVLKLAKGGVVEDVEIVEQPNEEVDEEPGTEGPRDQGSEDQSEQSSIVNRQSSIGNTLWLRSTKFADDMDRVLRRKDGRLTYIASDVAYHRDKLQDELGVRNFKPDKLITILGPDHHGYIGRLHAVVAALLEKSGTEGPGDRGTKEIKGNRRESEGIDHRSPENAPTPNAQRPTSNAPTSLPLTEIVRKLYTSEEERDACLAALEESKKRLEVIIFQIVRFVKEGKPAPMRKRDGNIYSLRDLMTEIGKDAAPNASPEEQMVVGKDVARFFYLMRSHDTHMDFDIDLATKGTEENPVFYVQYAHARICSILKKAESEGLRAKSEEYQRPSPFALNPSPKDPLHPKESSLIKKILDLPDEVLRCAADYGVHRLTTYAIELARTFHHFYDACRVIQPENPALTRQRLVVCHASQHALKGALDLLGVSAPERMEKESQQTG